MRTTLDIQAVLVQEVESTLTNGLAVVEAAVTAGEVVGHGVATDQDTAMIPCTSPERWAVGVETPYTGMGEEEEV